MRRSLLNQLLFGLLACSRACNKLYTFAGSCLGMLMVSFAVDRFVSTRKRRPPCILFIQFTNPGAYPPLHHSSRILAQAGWEVRVLATEDFESGVLRFPSTPEIHVTKLPFLPGMAFRKLHYIWFCIRAVWEATRWRASWVYASDLPSYPAALAASLTGKRVILHEHDSPGPIPAPTLLNRFLRFTRTRLAHRAVLNILPNHARAHAFQKQTGAKSVCVVWNCPSLTEIAEPEGLPHEGFVLYYHGNISSSLLPLTVIQALKLLPEDVLLLIIGYETEGHFGYNGTIRETAARLGLSDRVSVQRPVARFELFNASRQADVGLALFPVPTGPADSYAGASNKVFDYLCCGMPVLVTDSPEWNSFFSGEGCSVPCNPADPLSISQAILKLYQDRALLRAMGQRGKSRILSGWNYETQFSPVLKLLNSSRETI